MRMASLNSKTLSPCGLQGEVLPPSALQELWAVLQQLHIAHPESDWSDLGDWRLIPLRNNCFIRIGDRGAVFVAPDQAWQEASSPRQAAESAPRGSAEVSSWTGLSLHAGRTSETGSVTSERFPDSIGSSRNGES